MTNDRNFETQLTEAIESHSPLPRFPRDLTLEDAYARLPEVSAGVANGITAGIKAGITNPEIQALFGLEHALLGQLYDCG
ncbi:MAG: hypothetical protein JKX81_11150, partial [Arenicella sp.]|nr:hypothetical protein [Arenicella sp.]